MHRVLDEFCQRQFYHSGQKRIEWAEGRYFFFSWSEQTSHKCSWDVLFILYLALEFQNISKGRKSRDGIALPTHLTMRETEAQRGNVICWRTHSKWVAEPELKICVCVVCVCVSWYKIVSGKSSGTNSMRGMTTVAIKTGSAWTKRTPLFGLRKCEGGAEAACEGLLGLTEDLSWRQWEAMFIEI